MVGIVHAPAPACESKSGSSGADEVAYPLVCIKACVRKCIKGGCMAPPDDLQGPGGFCLVAGGLSAAIVSSPFVLAFVYRYGGLLFSTFAFLAFIVLAIIGFCRQWGAITVYFKELKNALTCPSCSTDDGVTCPPWQRMASTGLNYLGADGQPLSNQDYYLSQPVETFMELGSLLDSRSPMWRQGLSPRLREALEDKRSTATILSPMSQSIQSGEQLGDGKYDHGLAGYLKELTKDKREYLEQLFYGKMRASGGMRQLYETMRADPDVIDPPPSWREVRAC